MNFFYVFNFLLWLIGGIVHEPLQFVIKKVHSATKRFGYLTGSKSPEYEADGDNDDPEGKIVAEERVPENREVVLYARPPECKLNLIDWSLLLMGVWTIIIYFTRLYESRTKDKLVSQAMGQDQSDDSSDCQPSEEEGSSACTSFSENENEEPLDLKCNEHDLPADDTGFPELWFDREERFPYSEFKQQSVPDLTFEEEERLYLESTLDQVLELSSDEEGYPELLSHQEDFLDSPSDQEDFPDSPSDQEDFPDSPSDPSGDEEERLSTLESDCPSGHEDFPNLPPGEDTRFLYSKFKDSGFPDSPSDEEDRGLRLKFEKMDLADSPSDDEERSRSQGFIEKRLSELSELCEQVRKYNSEKKYVGPPELPSDVEDFPDLPSDKKERLPSVKSKEWMFPDVPSDKERFSDSPSDHRDLDLPYDKEERDLSLEFEDSPSDEEGRSRSQGFIEKRLSELSELCAQVLKYNSEKKYVGPPELPSDIEDFPDLPSDQRERPSNKERFSDTPFDHKDLDFPCDNEDRDLSLEFEDSPSDEEGRSHSQGFIEKRLSELSELCAQVLKYNSEKKYVGPPELPSDVEDFPDLPSDQRDRLPSVKSKEWMFPDRPPDKERFSDSPSDHRDLDLPYDNEDKDLSLEYEEVFPDSPPDEEERFLSMGSDSPFYGIKPYEELIGQVRNYNSEKKYVGPPELPSDNKEVLPPVESKEWMFSYVPSDKKGFSDSPSDHKDIDLPHDKEDRDLSLEFEDSPSDEAERSRSQDYVEKKMLELSELFGQVLKNNLENRECQEWMFPDRRSDKKGFSGSPSDHKDLDLSEKKYVGPPDLPSDKEEVLPHVKSKEWTFPDVPSDKKGFSNSPSGHKEIDIWNYKPEDFPELPSEEEGFLD